MSRRDAFAAAFVVATALALTGCFAPTPTPTPHALPSAPTADPSPSAAPVDPLSTVTTVVIRPESIRLADEAGTVVADLGYLSDVAAAIDTLTAVFGSEPTDEEFPGGSHDAPSTAHRWGGFTLWEPHYDGWVHVETAGTTLYLPAFRVQFTDAEAHGVSLTDVGGRQVGGSWADLTSDPAIQTNPSGCSGPYADFISQPEIWPDGTEHVQKVSVDFQPDEGAASIARIGAPMSVHEDGCA